MREKLSLTQRKRFCVSILLVVACLIFAIPGFADHKPGHTKGGGGGGDAFAKASLTGAFVFDGGALDVTLKTKLGRTIARSAQDVEMTRPFEDAGGFLVEDLRATWDAVFADCSVLLEGAQPTSIFVGDDDWRIEFRTDEIRLFLYNIFDVVEGPEITLQLIDDMPEYEFNPIPPDKNGTPSEFILDEFIISVRSVKGRTKVHCHPEEEESQFHKHDLFPVPSILSITAP